MPILTLGLVALIGVVFLVTPQFRLGNRAAIQAHQTLYRARTAGDLPPDQLQAAVTSLQEALGHAPDNAHFRMLLGSLHAWQGEHTAAIAELERRVQLDGSDTLPDYVPYVAWQRRFKNAPAPAPWASTSELYSHWLNRFPARAETYVLLATARRQQGQPDAAESIIAAGIERSAEPPGLLTHYLAGRVVHVTP